MNGTWKPRLSKRTLLLLTTVAPPFLTLVLIKPEWVGRLIGVAFFCTFVGVATLVYGLHPKSKFLHRKGKIARAGSARVKRNAQRVIRGLVILGGGFFLIFVTRPVLEDCFQTVQQGKPYLVETTGRVSGNDFIFGLYFVKQSLIIKDETRSDGYIALFFPRLARVGKTYHFLIAPKSKVVLDWSEVQAVGNRVNGN